METDGQAVDFDELIFADGTCSLILDSNASLASSDAKAGAYRKFASEISMFPVLFRKKNG